MTKNDVISALKAQVRTPKKPVALRLPEPLDEAIREIMKKSGASYTAVLVKLLELGLEVYKGER